MCFLLMTLVPVQKLCVSIYIYMHIYIFIYIYIYIHIYIYMCIPYMSYVIGRSIYNGSVIQYWRSCTPSRSVGLYFWGVRGSWAVCHFLFSLVQGLDLLWEYRIQHGANGPLDVTSSYSTWIFCRWVSGFATDCPCDVWCRGLTTCLLHVGPPFGNRILNNSWAVGLT